MGMTIEDGTGDGYQVKINNKNMLTTAAVTRGANYYANREENFYSSVVTVTPTSSGNCFYYIKNLCDDDLVFQRISAHVTSNEVIKGYLNDSGTPVDGTEYIPINRNGGSNKLCDCTVNYGSNITGLSGGNHFDSFHIPADNFTHTYRWEAGIMIPKNRTFTLYATNGSIEIDFTMTFFCCADI
jgi:hypothetical protein